MINSSILDSLIFAYKKPFLLLSKGETECIFSPQGGHTGLLEVDDCYIIADTIRFFSQNDGVFLVCLFETILVKLNPPFQQNRAS